MEQPIDHSAMPACGYVTRWSVRCGETVSLHASSIDPDARVSVERLDRHGDGEQAWPIRPGARLAHRSRLLGSWLEIDDLDRSAGATLTVEALITHNGSHRTLLAWDEARVTIDPECRLGLQTLDAVLVAPDPLPAWTWLSIVVRWDEAAIAVAVDSIGPKRRLCDLRAGFGRSPPLSGPSPHRLRFGRAEEGLAANWRIGRIRYAGGDHAIEWRLPVKGPVEQVRPVQGSGPSLRVFNDPTFACRSPRWDGSVHDPRLAEDHYDAVHLHEDDCGDLGWPVTHSVCVPEDADSGVYAFVIATAAGCETIPFFVRPAAPRARAAFLVPTLTYAAYADEALPRDRYPWLCDDRGHRFAQDNGFLSLYDVHADGSGVSLTNLHHPKATLRDDALYPLCGCPHLLPVDLMLIRFCHDQQIAFDVLTDGDLHEEGVDALRSYAGIFTGSHPEYWTGPMQAALAAFLARGGNLAHLGGNGFMWVAALQGARMEVRRGQGLGSRTWDGLPGESLMSLTGEIGGLWRERGRPEFGVVGTGMTMMGFGPARPFRRTPESHEAAWSWIFQGVGDETIGAEGRVLGAAAGYEVDRVDGRLGTPPGTVVLATAHGFGPEYEVDGNEFFPDGASGHAAARRADMAIRRDAGCGFVFSAGSVAWCGALPETGAMNAVGRITRNILARFAGSARLDGGDEPLSEREPVGAPKPA